MVHARRATDAAQHVLELRPDHAGPPVVEQDDMVFLRPVEVPGPACPGGERRVDREILPRRRKEGLILLTEILQAIHVF